MRLSDLVYWLLDLPADGWRVLASVARIYRDGDDELRAAVRSQVSLVAGLVDRRRGTRVDGVCYNPAVDSLSLLLMPNGRGGLYVMTLTTTRVSCIDPDPDRRAA